MRIEKIIGIVALVLIGLASLSFNVWQFTLDGKLNSSIGTLAAKLDSLRSDAEELQEVEVEVYVHPAIELLIGSPVDANIWTTHRGHGLFIYSGSSEMRFNIMLPGGRRLSEHRVIQLVDSLSVALQKKEVTDQFGDRLAFQLISHPKVGKSFWRRLDIEIYPSFKKVERRKIFKKFRSAYYYDLRNAKSPCFLIAELGDLTPNRVSPKNLTHFFKSGELNALVMDTTGSVGNPFRFASAKGREGDKKTFEVFP